MCQYAVLVFFFLTSAMNFKVQLHTGNMLYTKKLLIELQVLNTEKESAVYYNLFYLTV